MRRLRSSLQDQAVALVLGATALLVHLPALASAPIRHSDEGIYVAQGWALRTHGALSPWPYWYDHPPLGWALIGAWAALEDLIGFGAGGLAAGRHLAAVMVGASSALLFLLGRRLGLSRTAAGLAVVAFVLSPLAFHQHRQAFLDNLATPFILGSFLAAKTGGRRGMVEAGVLLGLAALVKETSLLFGPVLVMVALAPDGEDARHRRRSVTALVGSAALVVALYPLLALVRGELLTWRAAAGPSLLRGAHFQLLGRAGSGSILDADSPRRELFDLWLSIDPWLVLLGLLALPVAISRRRLRPAAIAVLIGVAAALRPGYVPAMLPIAYLPFLALLVAAAAETAWRDWSRPRPWVPRLLLALPAVILLAAWVGRDLDLLDRRGDGSRQEAIRWVAANVPRDRTLLVDGGEWLDVVEAGYRPEKVIVAREFDRDVLARATTPTELPPGTVILVTPPVARSFDRTGQRGARLLDDTRTAVQQSRQVASFGEGDNAVAVRVYGDGGDGDRSEGGR